MKLHNVNAMEEDEEEESVFINRIEEQATHMDDADTVDLPTSVIVTNVAPAVFQDSQAKSDFESVFQGFGSVAIQYFKSFRRALVNFENAQMAASARIQLHQAQVCDRTINCYFAQVLSPKDDKRDPHLHPPAPTKQYLISPPASPPVGWEPVEEAEPMVNYDLLSALTSLEPGGAHELHPPTEDQPGIVVHPCGASSSSGGPKIPIAQTRCPQRES